MWEGQISVLTTAIWVHPVQAGMTNKPYGISRIEIDGIGEIDPPDTVPAYPGFDGSPWRWRRR